METFAHWVDETESDDGVHSIAYGLPVLGSPGHYHGPALLIGSATRRLLVELRVGRVHVYRRGWQLWLARGLFDPPPWLLTNDLDCVKIHDGPVTYEKWGLAPRYPFRRQQVHGFGWFGVLRWRRRWWGGVRFHLTAYSRSPGLPFHGGRVWSTPGPGGVYLGLVWR